MKDKTKAVYLADLDYFQSLAEENPDIDLNTQIAFIYLRLGKYDDAIAALNNALEKQPSHTQLQVMLAEAFIGVGRKDEAREALLDIVITDSNNYKALKLLGSIFRSENDAEKSLKYLRAAYLKAPEDTELLTWLDELGGLDNFVDTQHAQSTVNINDGMFDNDDSASFDIETMLKTGENALSALMKDISSYKSAGKTLDDMISDHAAERAVQNADSDAHEDNGTNTSSDPQSHTDTAEDTDDNAILDLPEIPGQIHNLLTESANNGSADNESADHNGINETAQQHTQDGDVPGTALPAVETEPTASTPHDAPQGNDRVTPPLMLEPENIIHQNSEHNEAAPGNISSPDNTIAMSSQHSDNSDESGSPADTLPKPELLAVSDEDNDGEPLHIDKLQSAEPAAPDPDDVTNLPALPFAVSEDMDDVQDDMEIPEADFNAALDIFTNMPNVLPAEEVVDDAPFIPADLVESVYHEAGVDLSKPFTDDDEPILPVQTTHKE